MAQIGIVTRSYNGMTVEECAAAMAADGFQVTELCFTFADLQCWNYNGVADTSVLTPEALTRVSEAFKRNGIRLHSIGAFTNPATPDAALFGQVCAAWEDFCKAAVFLGISVIATETGFIPGRRGVNTDTYEADFRRFADQLGILCDIAAKYGLTVALEACMLDYTPSAKRTADFIRFTKRDNLQVLLDPANLIHTCDEFDMFRYLGEYISYCHGKDRIITDTYGRNLGEGMIDWQKFFLYHQIYAPDTPVILEYVSAADAAAVRDLAVKYDREAMQRL